MTSNQRLAADFIITTYKEKGGVTISKIHFWNALHQNTHSLSDIRYAIEILLHKDLLAATDGVLRENLFLTDKGWQYETYEILLTEEKRRIDLEEALITSSISSNKSVKYVNRLFWLTAAFAFFSSVGTVGTFILELHKEDKKPLLETPKSYLDTIQKSKETQIVLDSSVKR